MMYSNKWKRAAVLCAALAVGGLLCACNGQSQSTGVDAGALGDTGGLTLPITDRDVKLSALVEVSSELKDSFVLRTLKEITGVTVEPIATTNANSQQKLMMLAASKQLPDISLHTIQSKDRASLAENGALVCISDRLDDMPNLKALYEKDEDMQNLFQSQSEADGKVYFVPGYDIKRDVNHVFMYRKDIFDKEGIAPWTDREGFYQALKTLKARYPDSYPLTSKQQFGLIDYLRQQWGMPTDCAKDANGGYTSYRVHDNMYDMLSFLRQLYAEGLLDPEFLTNTQASWTTKMTSGEMSFVTFDWVDRMDMFREMVKEQNPDFQMAPGYPIGLAGKYQAMSTGMTHAMLIANNAKADVSVKLVDFLLSEAGARLGTVGIEGETYQTSETGKVTYIGFENAQPSTKDLQDKYGMFVAGICPRFHKDSAYYQYTPQVQKAQEMALEHNLVFNTQYNPSIRSAADKAEYDAIENNLVKEFEVFASNYILGKSDAASGWNEWVEKAKSLGIERYEEIYATYANSQS